MPGALRDKRHLLFDLDGTLVDSSPAHAAAFREALLALAPALAPGFDYERVRGVETRAAMRMLGVDEARLARAVDAKREAYRALRRCETRDCARREMREGYREVEREKREARREIRGAMRDSRWEDDRWRDRRDRDDDRAFLKGALVGAALVGVTAVIIEANDDD